MCFPLMYSPHKGFWVEFCGAKSGESGVVDEMVRIFQVQPVSKVFCL
jgi:hypothetical protein